MSDRPLGAEVPGFTPPPFPADLHLKGRWADLRPLTVDDAAPLWDRFKDAPWTFDYLYEPAPQTEDAFARLIGAIAAKESSPAYAIRDASGAGPLGYATFYTNVPAVGCTEIGNVNLSPALQRSPAATDAFFLMLDWAFAAGYRRVEWKCNSLNAPSRRAAERLGFSFEGIFRQHLIVKGRNRDTAWFAMTDGDWSALRPAYEIWLDPANFDEGGQQRSALRDLTAPTLARRDPTL